MESIFNSITTIVMIAAIAIGVLAFPVIMVRCLWELAVRRSKPGSWYVKLWLLPFGFFLIAGLTFILRSLSPVFWGKPTGGVYTVETKLEKDGQIIHSEKRTTDIVIGSPTQVADQNNQRDSNTKK